MNEELRKAIIHDTHKMFGRSHDHSHIELKVKGPDGDAARLSRPVQRGKIDFDDNESNYRISMITWKTFYSPSTFNKGIYEKIVNRDYINTDCDVEVLYQRLLSDTILFSKFNEHVKYLFTSLKYHSILVTNLMWNTLRGKMFDDLYLHMVEKSNEERCFARIMEFDDMYLTISEQNRDAIAFVKIGRKPVMEFGETLCRMRGDVNIDPILWANLCRIRSWSTGLQYFEDVRGSL